MNPEDYNLIILSNAEPYAHNWEGEEIVCEKIAGGLTSALEPTMRKSGGTWIAWGRGDADFEVCEPGGSIRVPEGDEETFRLKRLKLSDEEVEGFYYGFSNEIIWPISHSLMGRTTLKDYSSTKEKWDLYRRVNRRYTEAAIEEIERDEGIIWIHDYHLTLVPEMIKGEFPEAKIAFFWHIPWPPWEMFGNLPWRGEIMDGLLASDFIGFHTPNYKGNFTYCAKRHGNSVRGDTVVGEEGDETLVDSIPIGIDYEMFNSISSREETKKEARKLRENFPAEKIILSVDRLDYTKGIPHRLKAFELFLKEYPEYQGEVTLVQRIPPSRSYVKEYRSTLEEINKLVGEINGKLEKAGWTPIKSFHRYLPEQEMLIPYYRAGDVALLTPLRDGMNLVSKEYVACVDDGVLILSEFAGAAEKFEEAIRVNPYNSEEVAEAIKTALEMPPDEREERLEKLNEKVKRKDLDWWRDQFLERWLDVYRN